MVELDVLDLGGWHAIKFNGSDIGHHKPPFDCPSLVSSTGVFFLKIYSPGIRLASITTGCDFFSVPPRASFKDCSKVCCSFIHA